MNDYGAHAENGLDKKFLKKFQSGVGEGAVCTNEAALRRGRLEYDRYPEGAVQMMIRKTNSAANRAAGFSVGRAAMAVALTGVMGLGLVACNEDDDAGDSKMSETSSSEMTSESKMTEEKMTEENTENMMETEESMMPDKPAMSEKMDNKMDGKMEDKVENMMETDESMMPDLQGKQNK
ncbi:hypothetical protein jk0024 [Corynebacterium jeikeium K411]|uniref:Uncharacterized protein n=2 Tax=Corynebacterium jeikeium TaxID=38289 RepID=Q4JYD4_CORJK|nr:hypothetical protein jk0024 [Corynebacterium jeikeium K411]